MPRTPVALVACAVLTIAVLVAAGRLPVAARQDGTPPAAGGHAVAIHEGTCANPGTEPTDDLGVAEALVPGADAPARGTAVEVPVLQAAAPAAVSLDHLLDEGAHAVVVHGEGSLRGPIVACADLGGVVEEGRLVAAVRPVGGSAIGGVTILEEAGDGVMVTVYLVPDLAAPATPAP